MRIVVVLPGPVRAEEAVYLAGPNVQVQAVQRAGPAEALLKTGRCYGAFHAAETTVASRHREYSL